MPGRATTPHLALALAMAACGGEPPPEVVALPPPPAPSAAPEPTGSSAPVASAAPEVTASAAPAAASADAPPRCQVRSCATAAEVANCWRPDTALRVALFNELSRCHHDPAAKPADIEAAMWSLAFHDGALDAALRGPMIARGLLTPANATLLDSPRVALRQLFTARGKDFTELGAESCWVTASSAAGVELSCEHRGPCQPVCKQRRVRVKVRAAGGSYRVIESEARWIDTGACGTCF